MSENNTIESRLLGKLDMLVTGGFYLFMCAWFIASSRSAHHSIVYIFFLLPALVHLIAATIQRNERLQILRNPIFLSLTVFLTYMAISSTWSNNAETFPHYLSRLAMTLLFVYGVYIVTRQSLKHFELALVVACTAVVPWLIVNITVLQDEAFLWDRFKGAFAGVHYILTGVLMGSYLILLLAFLANKIQEGVKLPTAIAVFVIAVVIFYVVMLTESRSALVGIGTAGIYLFIAYRGNKVFRNSLIAAAILAMIIAIPYANVFIERGASQRFEIWEMTWERIAQNPKLGYGVDSEMLLNLSNGETVYDAHNNYLQILHDGGLIGAVLWAIFITLLIRAGWKSRNAPSGRYLNPLLIYSLTAVIFYESRDILSRPAEYWHLIWICAGLALAQDGRKQQKTKQLSTGRIKQRVDYDRALSSAN